VILINGQDFTAKNQNDFNTAIDVFRAAAEYWRSHAKPFWIFFLTTGILVCRSSLNLCLIIFFSLNRLDTPGT
jgi:hypothetical protein